MSILHARIFFPGTAQRTLWNPSMEDGNNIIAATATATATALGYVMNITTSLLLTRLCTRRFRL